MKTLEHLRTLRPKTPPQCKRITPPDRRRLGDLTGRKLTPEESAEYSALIGRLVAWSEWRDKGGTVIEADGRRTFPAGLRRDVRTERARAYLERRRARKLALENAMAAKTVEDAVRHLCATFPDLNTRELHAGMMHGKGESWAAMMKACGCSRRTLALALDRFYSVTRFPRPDRRPGGPGKALRFNDARDRAAAW